ncbi:MAG: PKD domain-containing protein [Bacteroidetes bacterium]|jgi:PKD repeat protein|nr:PKD domain-containing protein [Bacteroidota bacterium]MBT6686811.1 PKD domain-containing protein [Bacteroidota bacterium]MBT7144141.1 PKD domain-containing protein [Bacteroidota bacterium]MBT7490077.1 PKD domain-containing protein [Bacteroidota bacterium]
MKKLFIIFIFSFLTIKVFSQLYISGNIIDSSNTPVPYHMVSISSDGNPLSIVYSDISGNYLFYSPNFSCNCIISISTLDCLGEIHQISGSYTPYINHDFQICFDTSNISSNCSSYFFFYSGVGTLFEYQFFDGSFGNAYSWEWDFGDNTYSSIQNPYHTFTDPGTYNVCLTISNLGSCSDTYCDSVTVDGIYIPTCQALFFSSATIPPTNIDFGDISYSSGTIVEWFWDFDDGNTSTLQNPSHTFQYSGDYNVCLKITTDDSCTNTFCNIVHFIGPAPVCQANFNSIHDSLMCSGCFQFSENSTTSGLIIDWFWDFGDGDTSTLQNPNHIYSNYGTYFTCLTVFTDDNCENTFCDSITFFNPPQICEANFSYNIDTSNSCQNCFQFSDSSMSSSTINEWNWNFGDGDSSIIKNPNHIYAINGEYIVCLTIKTIDSCTSSFCDTVFVSGNIPLFSISGVVKGNFLPIANGEIILFGSGKSWTNSINFGEYIFTDLEAGNYISYAIPENTTISNFAPTYLVNSLYWSESIEISLNSNIINADIELISFQNNFDGNGVISGTIVFIDSTNTNKEYERNLNLSLENISVLLLDMEDKLLDYILTDASGNFAFRSLPFGTYKIYTEITGYQTFPAIVRIDAGNQIIENIEIIIYGDQVIIGIKNDLFNKNSVQTYPNPVKNKLNIEFALKKCTYIELYIYNEFGQNVYTNKRKYMIGKHAKKIDVNSLPNGLYFLRIQAESKSLHEVKFVK